MGPRRREEEERGNGLKGGKGGTRRKGEKGRGNRSRTVTAVYYLLLVATCGVEVKDEMEGVCVCLGLGD